MRKATGNYRTIHLYKTATLVPEFAVEDLPLGKTAVLVPEFAVKDLPLDRTLDDDDDDDDEMYGPFTSFHHCLLFPFLVSPQDVSPNYFTITSLFLFHFQRKSFR